MIGSTLKHKRQMTNEYFISITLDKRRVKKNGKYPVKLQVFTPDPRKQVYYPTIFDFSEKEFQSIWETEKPRNEYKDDREKLNAILRRAKKKAEKLNYFTFEGFEDAYFKKKEYTNKDVVTYYNNAITQYKANGKISTAENYDSSLKTLLKFHKNSILNFIEITPDWLNDFEKDMILKGKSRTTVGIYLRPLRAIFNTAISDKTIKPDVYPFGKRKYTIPTPKGVKKALTKDELKTLFNGIPETPEQEKAKMFWFFSYSCNGMNIKDIANLQYKNISGEVMTFRRAKTTNTNKNQAPVIVYLNGYTQSVIDKYGNKNITPDTYIFNIVDHTATAEIQHSQIKIFTRFINQHFLKYAKSLKIDYKISTYWARHTFATTAIRNGASLEYVSEALSHSNMKTTIGYFAGFEDEKKREISKGLMNFDN